MAKFKGHLVSLQHVQAEQHVLWRCLQHGKGGGEEVSANLKLAQVDTTEDPLLAYSKCHSCISVRERERECVCVVRAPSLTSVCVCVCAKIVSMYICTKRREKNEREIVCLS